MSKPILYQTASYAFDAAKDHDFEFQYSGPQAFSNTLIIRNNETNEIVYHAAQTTMQQRHTLPAGSLSNGVLYNVCVFTTDRDGINSELSDPLIFYCYSTPSFDVNITENQVISDSSYQVAVSYAQDDEEPLQSYQVTLYNTSKQALYTSPVRYDTALPVSINSLEDNASYYIRATGETVNHMALDTGYVFFMVKYIQPNYYSFLVAENNRGAGVIDLTSFIVSIEGRTLDGTDPQFLEGDLADTINGSEIVFDHGFQISSDFLLRLCFYPCGQNVSPLRLGNGTLDIVLTERRRYGKLYYELTINSGQTYYIITSEYVDVPDDTDILYLWVKKKQDLCELHLISIRTALWGNVDDYTWADLSEYTWENVKRITINGTNSTIWDELAGYTWQNLESHTWDNIRRITNGENNQL